MIIESGTCTWVQGSLALVFILLNFVHFQQLWADKIQRKFQNARKRDPEIREMLVVKARKRKALTQVLPKSTPAKEKNSSPRYPPMWGMQNYLPARPSSEDDISILRHKKWLQLEILKKRPDYKAVSHLMEITLADRRKEIVKKVISLQGIKENYPWLFTEHEVGHLFMSPPKVGGCRRYVFGSSINSSKLMSGRCHYCNMSMTS